MTEFTKGNWFVHEDSVGSIDITTDHYQNYLSIGVCTDGDDCANNPEALANAHLIAAAPEMYELLDNIRILCEWGHNEIDLADEMLMKLDEIKDQLKKARGE